MKGIAFIAYYVGMLLVSVPAIWYANRLFQRYHQRYLFTFLYYLITTAAYTLIVYFTPDLFNTVLLLAPPESMRSVVDGMTYFTSYPMWIIYFYLFARFFAEINLKELSRRFRIGFIAASSALGVAYCLGVLKAINSGDWSSFIDFYLGPVRFLTIFYRLGIIVWALYAARNLSDVHAKELTRKVGWFFLFGSCFHYTLRYVPQLPMIYFSRPFVFLLFNIIPLFIMNRHLMRYSMPTPVTDYTPEKLAHIAGRYNLSKREQEILLLLLNGLSNKEIEDKLFISIATVKNHVYKIFQKFGVESRLKLMLLVNDQLRLP